MKKSIDASELAISCHPLAEIIRTIISYIRSDNNQENYLKPKTNRVPAPMAMWDFNAGLGPIRFCRWVGLEIEAQMQISFFG
jgi:hypothetical protein